MVNASYASTVSGPIITDRVGSQFICTDDKEAYFTLIACTLHGLSFGQSVQASLCDGVSPTVVLDTDKLLEVLHSCTLDQLKSCTKPK